MRARLSLRVVRRAFAWLVAFPIASLTMYAAAVAIGGLIPANAGWRQPRGGVLIFVRTNGLHTWIMVPTVSADMDWRPIAPARDMKDARYAGNYLAIGFGNRAVYLDTPTWADLTARKALAAAVGGGPSLMQVDHVWNPVPDQYQWPIRLRRVEYRRLAAFIAASFRYRHGRSMPLIGRGYGPSDVFYESVVPYNFGRTCNAWTGEALRAAGVRAGIWTPLSQSIMWRLD